MAPNAVTRAGSSEESGGLLRSNLVVAAGTALSRITGLARLAFLGFIIGQTALADAYDGANNSPNAIYELLLGGVLSASLVPLFARHAEDDDVESTNAVIGTMVVILAAITAVSVLAAPLIFRLQSLHVDESVDAADYRSVGTSLTRILLLQIFFYGLSALFGAVLNARRQFFAWAWSPVLSNLVMLASLLVVQAELQPGDPFIQALGDAGLRRAISIGSTAGIAAMALSMYPAVRRTGVRLRPRFQRNHPAVRQMFRLSRWTLGYAAANVLTVVVIKNLANPGSSGQDAYSKAFTLFQLPHGLLAMSISTTFVPDLARFVQRKDRPGFIERAGLGVRLIALLTMPAAGLLFVLRRPIVGLLLQHRNFDAAATLRTSQALGGFAVGLAAFSVYLFVLRAFYAHGDARTPFIINVVECALNIVLAVALVGRYGVMGLGLAFAIAYVICAAWALQILSYKIPGFDIRSVFGSFGRLLLATVVLMEAAYLGSQVLTGSSGVRALVSVLLGSIFGTAAYLIVLRALRAPELDAIRTVVSRKRSGSLPTSTTTSESSISTSATGFGTNEIGEP